MHLILAFRRSSWNRFGFALACAVLAITSGCAPLRPRAIVANELLLSPQLKDEQPQVQRGKRRKVIDAVGWVIGIPDKIVLWNRRVDNHNISPRTEAVVSEYLAVNGLATTRVRLNQYAPLDDWKRLVRNKRVGAPWRYTFGTVTLLYETVLPGRVFGNDHYNPYSDTVHLYSDIPAIALHEAGHAKDFARRKWKGTYAAVYILPGAPLYHESIATGDALAFAQTYASPVEHKEAYNVLYPAYGTYAGSALETVLPRYSNPLYYGSVIGGHIWGRSISRRLPEQESISLVESYTAAEAASAEAQ